MAGPQTVVVVPGISPDVFPWDKYPVPHILYKYFPPERLPVLTRCLIRFSQRQVFEDTFELMPEVSAFGNEDEIRKFMEIDPVLNRGSLEIREAVIHHVLNTPGRHAALIEQTRGWLSEVNMFGVLCLSDNPLSASMWQQYAGNGTGFLVAFNTRHAAFNRLRSPGKLGKVEYSDQPITSFLAAYGANTFFRKRTQYAFESEWRSIRRFTRFPAENVIQNPGGLPIYLAPFDPACVCGIFIQPQCAIEWELRTLVSIDARYRHVPVLFSPFVLKV